MYAALAGDVSNVYNGNRHTWKDCLYREAWLPSCGWNVSGKGDVEFVIYMLQIHHIKYPMDWDQVLLFDIKSGAIITWYSITCYPTPTREFQGFRLWRKFVFRMLELTDTPTNLANQLKWVMLLTNHAVSNHADLRERTKTMSSHGNRRWQIDSGED